MVSSGLSQLIGGQTYTTRKIPKVTSSGDFMSLYAVAYHVMGMEANMVRRL